MMDILHYLFEEDSSRYTSGEQAEAISAMRTQLYLSYGKTYAYGVKGSSSKGGKSYIPKGAAADYGFDEDPLTATGGQTKGYVPPTDFNPDSALPFGSELGAPLG